MAAKRSVRYIHSVVGDVRGVTRTERGRGSCWFLRSDADTNAEKEYYKTSYDEGAHTWDAQITKSGEFT